MKKTMYVIIGILLCTSLVFTAEVTKVGTTSAGFLGIDVGASAVAMGGAYVAVAEDASAMYWNPAGIARMDKFSTLFHHTKWLADISINYMGIVLPVTDFGSFGVNIASMTMDDMERTTRAIPDGTGEFFSAGSYAIGLSFAKNLTDRFSMGFNVKYIRENIYHSSAQGAAFDVGILFNTQFEGLILGMSISNYGTKMQMQGKDMLAQIDIDPLIAGNNQNINAYLKTDEFDLPLMFRVGAAIDLLRDNEKNSLLVAVDALHPNNDSESVNVGAEYGFNKMFFLRGGYNTLFAEDSESGMTLGAGFAIEVANTNLHFDYAYWDFGILNDVQIFTMGLSF